MGIFARFRSSPYYLPTLKALTWFPVVMFVADHVVSFGTIDGRSMQVSLLSCPPHHSPAFDSQLRFSLQPTFNPDSNQLWRDRVLLNKWAVTDHNFERGEVVTLV